MPRATPRKTPKTAKKRPVQARSRATWEAILTAAARILVRRGYASMTTNHVAAAAGVSIGSLYEYFPNKDAIVHTLLDWHLSEAEAALAYADARFFGAALDRPLRASIEQLVATLVALHAHDPGLHRVLFEEAARLPAVRKRAEAMELRLGRLLTELLQHHREARRENAALRARIIVRAVESLIHGWVTAPTSAPAEQAVLEQEIVSLVLAYARR